MARAPRAGEGRPLVVDPSGLSLERRVRGRPGDAAGSERVVACDVNTLDLHGSAAAALLDRQLADVPS